jgi:Flp pilus assembly protein TadD
VLTALVIVLWQGIARRTRDPLRYRVAAAAALVLLGTLAVLSRHRLRDYRSTLAIWEDTARKSPGHSTAQNNYARELIIAGRHQEAIPHLREAIAMRPDLATPHYLLGFALVLAGDAAGGTRELRESLRLNPDSAESHFALGRVFVKAQDWEAAERELGEALRLSPDDEEYRRELARVHHQMARAAAQAGNQSQLVEHLRSEVRLQPDSALAHLNLGSALASGDQFEAGTREWLEAVRVAPEDPRVRDRVVSLLRRLPPSSRSTLDWALRDPDPAVRAAADAGLASP